MSPTPSPAGSKAYPINPVLKLDLANIADISSGGPQGLSYMWTVFSKCRESLADGQRLENLSWRLWYEDLRVEAGRRQPIDSESDTDTSFDSEEEQQHPQTSLINSRISSNEETRSPLSASSVHLQSTVPKDPVEQLPEPHSFSAERSHSRSRSQYSQSADQPQPQPHPYPPSSEIRNQPTLKSDLASDNPPPVQPTTSSSYSPEEASSSSSAPSTSSQPNQHRSTRRSSCPTSNDRPLKSASSSSAQPESFTSACTRKSHRASTSIATREQVSRIRSRSSLTPRSLRRIIGEVLPMEFENGPELLPRRTASSSSITASSKYVKRKLLPVSPEPCVSSSSQGALEPSPTIAAPQHAACLQPDRSFAASTTAVSKSGDQPIFSPKAHSLSLLTSDGNASKKGQPAAEITDSTPLAISIVDSTVVSDTQQPVSNASEFIGHVPLRNETRLPELPSSTRTAKPAMTRGGSSTKAARSALQRLPSAKSVRILESKTNHEDSSLSSVSIDPKASSSMIRPGAQHRTSSSSRLRSHNRNSSTSHLVSQGQAESALASTPPGVYPSAQQQSEAEQRSDHNISSISSSKPVDIKGNNAGNRELALSKSVSRNSAVVGIDSSSSGTAASMQAAANAVPHPPPPSPASPSLAIPSSVVLPRQPYPSPSDARYTVHSTTRRPASPPFGSDQKKQKLSSVSENQSQLVSSTGSTMLEPQQHQVNIRPSESRNEVKTSTQNQGNLAPPSNLQPASASVLPLSTGVPANNNKKSKMFFLSSPTTDSDDDTLVASLGKNKNKKNALAFAKPGPLSPVLAQEQHRPQGSDSTHTKAERKTKEHSKPADEESDDDDLVDEDDSDWSNEASESEEDNEQQMALRVEEERQRSMFAKRVPSQANVNGGLLSQLLHPEEYPRNFANLPSHLRINRSAFELARARPSGTLQGLDRRSDGSKNLTVTGLHASKSTAALPNLDHRPKLATTASGNCLTRLRGAPSGVEMESDDDNNSEGEATHDNSNKNGNNKSEFTPAQHDRLVTLMHKRGSSTTHQKTGPSSATATAASAATTTLVAIPELPPRQQQQQQVVAVQVQGATAYTPRTTRRNMLATELTESLRMNLIWERQSRNRLTNGGARGLGGMVIAVGNRLVGRQAPQQQQQQQQNPSSGIPQEQDQTQDAQEQGQGKPHQPSNQPKLLRGSSLFHENRVAGQEDLSSKQRSSGPVSGTAKSSSDANNDYYSPGFHHVGW